ncbi:bifunctional 3-(3-hydroxy-phenyl)propionate/3-hydroxycinnamic acid hydroxylase [Noviherbaspirillum sedimenti]|uniref:Bifunctional 3-(3-hydroxy-phenyl)propionate/3-hydroxycinnamic acid hydroxylase n=1 Tax=Noviherbaspirillum sedimenti TaxID=2320865 RepID=A0A3A3GB47_9BURK|nr:bifunctional 3-(3-hydroxy-phenyl)propionate/3-hydroxycinnamic acid hydroxylase [Noviherbaspirillum sedimenti]RJG04009.1 bifunctional 3-(3-hydroxy-phenyl)propionate/3-hydroxycinnamic acid hydroxylase [Noviherbaspirillum sedimenti]
MREIYDVAIVGYGPAGEVLASTLGAAGARVLIVERWPQPYPLPRLTTLDGEVCRVIQATSTNIDAAFEGTLVQESCKFVDADGEPVLVVPFPGKLGGWPSRVSMFQPDFEKAILDKVDSMPNVELLRGWEAAELWQDDEFAHLTISPLDRATAGAGPRTIQARYLVGSDGARSFVRQMLGVGMHDFNMHQRWLNFDAENLRPLPPHLMSLKIFMDPERPHMHMPIGKHRLRLEFRVMEGENDEQMTNPTVAWEFMARKHGIGPEDVRILRQVVYHYRTRLAMEWRVGRVFLAGDAAHTMPPYMGQGACSAIRDGRNLGWKLNEVLAGRSSECLLDEYRAEREPHAKAIVMASDMLSHMVNITAPEKAAERNMNMRLKGEAQPPDLPSLSTGVVHRESDGTIAAPSGTFAPQGILRRNDHEGRGDDILGGTFQLWSRSDPKSFLSSAERCWLKLIDCSIAVFDQPDSANAVEDVEGVYRDFLNRHDVDVVIIRPDFYVFGAGRQDQVSALLQELAQRLHSTLTPDQLLESV